MQCDMCGKDRDLKEVIVEGSLMNVCGLCGGYGVEVIRSNVVEKKKVVREEIVDFVVDEFGHLIKKGRERKGLKQEELSRAIGEKESLVHAAEAGRIKPSLKVARKLEVFLGIKLVSQEIGERPENKQLNFNDSRLTIGDLLKG